MHAVLLYAFCSTAFSTCVTLSLADWGEYLLWGVCVFLIYACSLERSLVIVQELCESRGGRPGLSVLTSLLVSVDVKLY